MDEQQGLQTQRIPKVQWECDGCKSIIRFCEDEPMDCFSQGVLAGLLLVNHRKKCQGNHFENGVAGGVSLEIALLGAVEGKSWDEIQQEAEKRPFTHRS